MPRVSCLNDKNPEKKKFEKKNFFDFFLQNFFFSIFFFSGFSSFRQLTLGMGVFIRFMGSPDCKDLKNAMGEVNFLGTWFTPLFGGFGGMNDLLKDWKKNTFRNGFSLSETIPLNHNWLDFAIELGLVLHQFKINSAVKWKVMYYCDVNLFIWIMYLNYQNDMKSLFF